MSELEQLEMVRRILIAAWGGSAAELVPALLVIEQREATLRGFQEAPVT